VFAVEAEAGVEFFVVEQDEPGLGAVIDLNFHLDLIRLIAGDAAERGAVFRRLTLRFQNQAAIFVSVAVGVIVVGIVEAPLDADLVD